MSHDSYVWTQYWKISLFWSVSISLVTFTHATTQWVRAHLNSAVMKDCILLSTFSLARQQMRHLYITNTTFTQQAIYAITPLCLRVWAAYDIFNAKIPIHYADWNYLRHTATTYLTTTLLWPPNPDNLFSTGLRGRGAGIDSCAVLVA